MQLNAKMFLIVCPMLFIAGLVDAIGGGGGLISLPAYLFAGIPIHSSIATNKLSSTCGTSLATFRFIKHKLVDFKLAIPWAGTRVAVDYQVTFLPESLDCHIFAPLPMDNANISIKRLRQCHCA